MNKYVNISILLFIVVLLGYNVYVTVSTNDNKIYIGGQNTSNNIPQNYFVYDDIPNSTIINEKTIKNIFDNKFVYNNSVKSDCYHPIISLGDSGEFLFGNCLSEVMKIGNGWKGSFYKIISGVNNGNINTYMTGKTFVEMGSFFNIIRQNDSDLLNQYIKTLRTNDQYIIYKNAYKLIDSQQYKKGILTMWIQLVGTENHGIAFKYYLFDGRQYDFSLKGDMIDDMGSIPFSRYSDIIYKDGCYVAYPNKNYDTFIGTEVCYNYIKNQFQSTGSFLKTQIDQTKDVIFKMIK